MLSKEEEGVHINSKRLYAAATTAVESTVEELRHMLTCVKCLTAFSTFRVDFRNAKPKARKQAQ